MSPRTRPQSATLTTYLRKSALGHLIFFVLVFGIFPWIASLTSTPPTRIIVVELPRGTSETDISGMKQVNRLPETTVQDAQKPPTPPAEETAPKLDKQTTPPPPAVNDKAMKELALKEKAKKEAAKKPTNTVTSDAMRKALAKINKDVTSRSSAPEVAQSTDGGQGNLYGTSDKPQRVSDTDPEYLRYYAKMRAAIMKEWILPSNLVGLPSSSTLSTKIVIMINENGNVIDKQTEKSSGNGLLDASAIRAIERAQPLPTPPEKLKWEAINEGFLIEFRPSAAVQP